MFLKKVIMAFRVIAILRSHRYIREESIPKICLSTKFGIYEYTGFPFGPSNAPRFFVSTVNEIFRI